MLKQYPSNTYVGSCSNNMLFSDTKRTITSRMFFRVIDAGKFPYRFAFCNTVDSTFSDGKKSHANLSGDEFIVESASVGVCAAPDGRYGRADDMLGGISLEPLTFSGEISVSVAPDATLFSDEIELNVGADDYLIFEWTVTGKNIPYTPDKMFPCYVKDGEDWLPSNECPQPFLVGCKRKVDKIIGFWGDSITQGLQTRNDMYEFWVAEIGRRLPGHAIWNLGLGFGRGEDAATLGTWFDKAKNCDFISLCFGVNDIRETHDSTKINEYLKTTVDALKKVGVRVGILTIPPCSYAPAAEKIWRDCCDYIKNELSADCEYVFDTSSVWGMKPPRDHYARWNAHPNGVGCRLLAEKFIEANAHIFEK